MVAVVNEIKKQWLKEDIVGESNYCKALLNMSLEVYFKLILSYQNKGYDYDYLKDYFKFDDVRKCLKDVDFYKELENRNIKPDNFKKGISTMQISNTFKVGLSALSYNVVYNLKDLKDDCLESDFQPLPIYNFALLVSPNQFLFLNNNPTILYL